MLSLRLDLLRQRSDLPEQADDVHKLPLLLDLAVAAAADREAGELDVTAGRRRAHQLAVVPPADRRTRGHVVALGELVLDGDVEPREGVPVALDHLG